MTDPTPGRVVYSSELSCTCGAYGITESGMCVKCGRVRLVKIGNAPWQSEPCRDCIAKDLWIVGLEDEIAKLRRGHHETETTPDQ